MYVCVKDAPEEADVLVVDALEEKDGFCAVWDFVRKRQAVFAQILNQILFHPHNLLATRQHSDCHLAW